MGMDETTQETGIQCWGFEGLCESKNATRYRQNTQYVDEESNWVTLCPDCATANDEHWSDMWSEYYASRL